MSSKHDANNNATANANGAPAEKKKGRAARRKMNAFISFLFGTFIFVIAFAFVIGHLFQGTYEGYVRAMYWGFPAFLSAGVAIFCAYYSFVIEPAKTKPLQPPADRPWLSIEVAPDGPIIFQNGTQATIPVKYRLTNTGHSPANDVRMKFDIVFPAFGSSPINRQRQIAQQPRAASLPFSSGVVFAGAPAEYQTAHIVSIDQMMEFATEEMKKNGPVEWTQPYIVGCINYTFGQSAFTGETGFIYEIKTRSIDNPKITLLLKINADVPEERLVFERYILGGDYAK
jgi:hypothetical protein